MNQKVLHSGIHKSQVDKLALLNQVKVATNTRKAMVTISTTLVERS